MKKLLMIVLGALGGLFGHGKAKGDTLVISTPVRARVSHFVRLTATERAIQIDIRKLGGQNRRAAAYFRNHQWCYDPIFR